MSKENVLVASLVETLEETAFVFADPTPNPDAFDAQVCVTTLDFRKDEDKLATLELVSTTMFADQLAETLLGECDEDTMGIEALKELLNIVAGRVSVSLFGESALIRITAPEHVLVTPEEREADASAPSGRVSVMTDEDERLDFSYYLV